MDHVLDQIRKAIQESDKIPAQISKETGIPRSLLSKLMHKERGLSIENLERVTECLGLEIIIRAKSPRQSRKGK